MPNKITLLSSEALALNSTYEIFNENGFYVIKDINKKKYIRLNKVDFSIWQMLKNGQSVVEVSNLFKAKYTINIEKDIKRLTKLLERAGFIGEQVENSKRKLQIGFHHPDRVAAKIYSLIPSVIFRKTTFWPLALFCIFMVPFFIITSGHLVAASKINKNSFIFVWMAINIILHELAHTVVCKHYKREIAGAGIKLNYGFPVFFVNTSDIIMTRKINRIFVSFAGTFSNLILGSFLYVGYYFTGNYSTQLIIVQSTAFSYIFAAVNLIPFLKLDGYYILSDLLGVINLKSNSKIAFKQFIRRKLKRRTSIKNLILIAYHFLSLMFNIVISGLVVMSIFNLVKGLI